MFPRPWDSQLHSSAQIEFLYRLYTICPPKAWLDFTVRSSAQSSPLLPDQHCTTDILGTYQIPIYSPVSIASYPRRFKDRIIHQASPHTHKKSNLSEDRRHRASSLPACIHLHRLHTPYTHRGRAFQQPLSASLATVALPHSSSHRRLAAPPPPPKPSM